MFSLSPAPEASAAHRLQGQANGAGETEVLPLEEWALPSVGEKETENLFVETVGCPG